MGALLLLPGDRVHEIGWDRRLWSSSWMSVLVNRARICRPCSRAVPVVSNGVAMTSAAAPCVQVWPSERSTSTGDVVAEGGQVGAQCGLEARAPVLPASDSLAVDRHRFGVDDVDQAGNRSSEDPSSVAEDRSCCSTSPVRGGVEIGDGFVGGQNTLVACCGDERAPAPLLTSSKRCTPVIGSPW